MTPRLPLILAYGSAAIIIAVNVAADAFGPGGSARPLLLLCGALAVAAAIQSAAWDPPGLPLALLASIPPVIALLSDGSPTWLIGPLGASLLVAGELNALSWELRGRVPIDAMARGRLVDIGKLGGVGFLASLAVGGVALVPSPGGTLALLVAAIAFVALASVMFSRGSY